MRRTCCLFVSNWIADVSCFSATASGMDTWPCSMHAVVRDVYRRPCSPISIWPCQDGHSHLHVAHFRMFTLVSKTPDQARTRNIWGTRTCIWDRRACSAPNSASSTAVRF